MEAVLSAILYQAMIRTHVDTSAPQHLIFEASGQDPGGGRMWQDWTHLQLRSRHHPYLHYWVDWNISGRSPGRKIFFVKEGCATLQLILACSYTAMLAQRGGCTQRLYLNPGQCNHLCLNTPSLCGFILAELSRRGNRVETDRKQHVPR